MLYRIRTSLCTACVTAPLSIYKLIAYISLVLLVTAPRVYADVIAEYQQAITIDELAGFNLDISYFGVTENGLSFRFGVGEFTQCTIGHLELTILDDEGGVVVSSRLGKHTSWYMFRLMRSYLKTAKVLLVCEQETPGRIDTFKVNLGEFEELLNNQINFAPSVPDAALGRAGYHGH